MQVTVLGTGTSHGMPAPFCGCKYCDSIERTRPTVLIESDNARILLDASPDIRYQVSDLSKVPGAVFVTHSHHDHSSGLKELYNTARDPPPSVKEYKKEFIHEYFGWDLNIYGSPKFLESISSEFWYMMDDRRVNCVEIGDSDTVSIGSLEVTGISTQHTDGYCAFKVSNSSLTVLYDPDFGSRDSSVPVSDVDLYIADGGCLLEYSLHGSQDELIQTINDINPVRTALVNVSEHLSQKDTNELRDTARQFDADIVSDDSRLF